MVLLDFVVGPDDAPREEDWEAYDKLLGVRRQKRKPTVDLLVARTLVVRDSAKKDVIHGFRWLEKMVSDPPPREMLMHMP